MRYKGVNTSGVPFIFWCLLGISAVITEYVVAIEKVGRIRYLAVTVLNLCFICFGKRKLYIVLLLFFLSFFFLHFVVLWDIVFNSIVR